MANYVNITLDTVAPAGVSLSVNGDDAKTSSTSAVLTIACTDADLTDYQMKIWGTSDTLTEDDAVWESFQTSKNVTLPTGDGTKTIFLKVRDDVYNESASVSDTIILDTKAPVITLFKANPAKISLAEGKNRVTGTIMMDTATDAVKVMVVQSVNSAYNDQTNIQIPCTNGSYIEEPLEMTALSGDTLEYDGSTLASNTELNFYIYGADLKAASDSDGVKIIKAFVRSAENGAWSV